MESVERSSAGEASHPMPEAREEDSYVGVR